MKKIINGLLYDTEKATLIFTSTDKRRQYYRTKNGNFFVVYRTGEFAIKREEDMREFLGENAPDKYIEIFGNVKEG